jgi:hypothetical protein
MLLLRARFPASSPLSLFHMDSPRRMHIRMYSGLFLYVYLSRDFYLFLFFLFLVQTICFFSRLPPSEKYILTLEINANHQCFDSCLAYFCLFLHFTVLFIFILSFFFLPLASPFPISLYLTSSDEPPPPPKRPYFSTFSTTSAVYVQ